MSDIDKRLLAIREKINAAKTRLDQAEGKIQTYEEQLKEFGCKSLPEAKKLLKKLDAEIVEEEEQLDTEIKQLEKKFKQATEER